MPPFKTILPFDIETTVRCHTPGSSELIPRLLVTKHTRVFIQTGPNRWTLSRGISVPPPHGGDERKINKIFTFCQRERSHDITPASPIDLHRVPASTFFLNWSHKKSRLNSGARKRRSGSGARSLAEKTWVPEHRIDKSQPDTIF